MKLDEAIIAAFEAHDGVLDKAGVPYINHPLRVMRKILNAHELVIESIYPYSLDDCMVVAVLHDVWEDTDYKLLHLNAVQSEALSYVTRHWGEFEGETYKEYIARCCQNPIAKEVKWFDLHDNLSPERMSYLEKGEQKGMTKRYQWSLEYIRELL